jgi:SpoVK/Ycf46/Vps4 family AAA+-type ATPase
MNSPKPKDTTAAAAAQARLADGVDRLTAIAKECRNLLAHGASVPVLVTGRDAATRHGNAAVFAQQLGTALYRIDLAGVVSKYIGETEKNLDSLFAAAQQSGSVLFFDEADALFGRRTEVRDSHDRYANIEVSHLLERIEKYRGIVVLATNMREDLDERILRRIRFEITALADAA